MKAVCPTPGCDGSLSVGRVRRLGNGNIQRRRNCRVCGYADIVTVQPERVLNIQVVRKRTELSVSGQIDEHREAKLV